MRQRIQGQSPLWPVAIEHVHADELRAISDVLDEHPAVTTALSARDYVTPVYLKASEPNTSAWIFAGWNDTEIVSVGTDWERFSIAFTLNEDTESYFLRVYLRGQEALWIDAAQIEEGDTPTDWVPGPDGP